MKRIRSLRGLTIALTGRCSWPRSELAARIKKKGGKVTSDSARVTQNTDILVRGQSDQWKHGTFGKKEARAAELIREGSRLALILSEDLDRLLAGQLVKEYEYVAGHKVTVLRVESQADAFPLDKQGSTNVRLEQGTLRLLHLGGRKTLRCSVCGRSLPVNLLVVGHIKPRARCTPAEKRDLEHVAMPICVFGCDALYERGFLTISPNGKIVASRKTFGAEDLSRLLSPLHGRRCAAHSSASEPYFKWHRDNVFIGPAR